MAESKKQKYQTKLVKFGTKSVTLYSLDGFTWSSKRQELSAIKERLEGQRITLGEIKAEDGDDAKDSETKKERDDEPVVLGGDDEDAPAAAADKDGEEKGDEDEADDPLIVDDLDDDLDDIPVARAKVKAPVSERVKPAPKARAKKPISKNLVKSGAKNRKKAA